MKKKRIKFLTGAIILLVVIFATIILINSKQQTPTEIAKCIGEKSVLYIQLGCHACEIQKNIFGESYQYLTIVDCFYSPEKCAEISATPTWIIANQKYAGVQSIEKLKELTKC